MGFRTGILSDGIFNPNKHEIVRDLLLDLSGALAKVLWIEDNDL